MTVGEHIMLLRKQKGYSQAELGKRIGTSGDIIGRYERNIMTPSIEVIIKISDILGVSIDFLVGKTTLELDQNTIKRIQDMEILEEEKKKTLFDLMDTYIRDAKTRQAYSA